MTLNSGETYKIKFVKGLKYEESIAEFRFIESDKWLCFKADGKGFQVHVEDLRSCEILN